MSSTSTPYPYLCVRVCGGAYQKLQELEIPCADSLAELDKKNAALRLLQDSLSLRLHEFIGSPSCDAGLRRQIINIRRTIHSGKHISASAVRLVTDKLMRDDLALYRGMITEIELLEAQAAQQYTVALRASRRRFRRLLRQAVVVRGLPLASDTIGRSLHAYLARSIDPAQPVSKQERSFMEYLARIHTKPSPFSTFTYTAGVAISPDINERDQGQLARVQSHMRLNHLLYPPLFELVCRHPKLRQHIPIRLNPSLYIEEGSLVFLANKPGNNDVLRQLHVTPALIRITRLIRSQPGWTLRRLCTALLEGAALGSTEDELFAYLDKLVDAGFIQFDLSIAAATPDWDKRFTAALTPFIPYAPLLEGYIHALTQVRQHMRLFAKAGAVQRLQHVQSAHQTLQAAIEQFAADGNIALESLDYSINIQAKHLWYEDCSAPDMQQLPARLTAQLDEVRTFTTSLSGLCGCPPKKEALRACFIEYFDKEMSVSVLHFYGKYLTYNGHGSEDEPEDNVTTRQQAWIDTFRSHLTGRRLVASNYIRLNQQDMPEPPHTGPYGSFGVFFQIQPGAKPLIVLNDASLGYGKGMSRFLGILPPIMLAEARRQAKQPDVLLAEPTDGSLFNAALHPTVCEAIIDSPGNQLPTQDAVTNIALSNLHVRYDAQADELFLFDTSSEKRVYACDLAIQNTTVRSRLYQLLSLFSPCEHHTWQPLIKVVDELYTQQLEDAVTMLPRIEYGSAVVVRRQTWRAPASSLPQWAPHESSWQYYKKAARWAAKLGIPDRFFVRFTSQKPQYISLQDPFLLAILARTIAAAGEQTMQITEMLPAVADPWVGNGEHACEYLVTVYGTTGDGSRR